MQQCETSSSITLRKVFEEYKNSKDLKPKTLQHYNQRLNRYLQDWLDIPVAEITKDMVEQRHREIAGPAIANSTMRTLRALMTFASANYEDASGAPVIQGNPVKRLSEARSWNRDLTRNDVIEPAELRAWFAGVYSLDSATFRDYLLVLLLTGMRKSEAKNLRWDQVILERGIIRLNETKNGESHEIPVSDFVLNILTSRKMGSRSAWVFTSSVSNKPISAGTKPMNSACERAGFKFSLHTLRRTFAFTACELGIRSGIIRHLMNEKLDCNTRTFDGSTFEQQRGATQQVTNRLLHSAGVSKPVNFGT
ncbi:MAG TPA: integrase [Drouetiella sp.]